MNAIFLAMVFLAFITAAWHQLQWPGADASPMDVLSKAMIDSAGGSVELALGLVGVMTLFLGLVKVAEAGGLLTVIARLIRPLMVRLFPDIPSDHPAMGAMVLNISANMLGLGNAATPFGIRAMQELNGLNPRPGTATDPMVLFLAINTSGVTLLPTGVIALRAAAGSADPAGILPTTLFATAFSTAAAIAAFYFLRRFFPFDSATAPSVEAMAGTAMQPDAELSSAPLQGYPLWTSVVALGFLMSAIPLSIIYGKTIAPWILPGLIVAFLAYGMVRGVRVYEVFVEGAKEGFQVAIRIIPYLVAILVAVGMLRASGALDVFVQWAGPLTSRLGLPAEALPMALLRPLSGSGAYGVLASVINDPAIGADSYTGYLVSTLQGSTETTFYVLAVYFGAVQVRRVRHALAVGIIADLAGVAGAIIACTFFLG